jgi:hypothetical protein
MIDIVGKPGCTQGKAPIAGVASPSLVGLRCEMVHAGSLDTGFAVVSATKKAGVAAGFRVCCDPPVTRDLFAHDLIRKPVSTPHQARGRLFRDHAP